MKKIFTIIGIVGIIFSILMMTTSCGKIESGYTGVLVIDGVVQDETLSAGRLPVLPARAIVKTVDNRRQTYEYNSVIYGESSDHTVVLAQGVLVTFTINPKESVWVVKNIPNYDSNIIPDVKVASSIKNAMANVDTDKVTNRSYIEPAAKIEMQTAVDTLYKTGVVEILDVSIKQMDYEDSYNEAIARISELKKAQEEQELQNSIMVSKAEAEAKARKIEAEGYAEAHIIEAEADVERMKMISEALTDNYIEYKKYEKWDGALPSHTNGVTYFEIDGNE